MLYLLSKYDKENKRQIKQTSWAIILLMILLTNFMLLFFSISSQQSIDQHYGLNLAKTASSLNYQIEDKKLTSPDGEQLIKLLKLDQIDKVTKIDELKTKKDWVEISHSNLPESLIVEAENGIYAQKAKTEYYGTIYQISHNNQISYLLSNGNIISKNYNDVKNNSLRLSDYFSVKITTDPVISDSTKLQTNQELELALKIKMTKKVPEGMKNLYINLDDFLEYSELILGPKLDQHNRIAVDLNELELNQTHKIKLLFKTDSVFNEKKTNANIKQSFDCNMALAIANARISVPVDCSLKKQANLSLNEIYLSSAQQIKIIFWLIIITIFFLLIKIVSLSKLLFINQEIILIRKNINKGEL